MKSTTFLILPTILALASLSAVAETIAGPSATAGDQILALKEQVEIALQAYLTNHDNGNKRWSTYYHLNDTNLPEIFELAKQDPGSETSFEAFSWIVTNRRLAIHSLQPYGAQSLQYLKDYHASDTNIGEICRTLGKNWDPLDPAAIDFLQAASGKNPDRQSRGFATLALGQMLKEKTEMLQIFPNLPPNTNTAWAQRDAKIRAELKKADANTVFQQSVEALEKVQKDYANCPTLPSHGIRNPKATLGEEAETELYELNHLTIGKKAPDLSQKDLDGHKLALSQYRGKIVLITFWASWCGPCMQMVPLERSLVEKYKDQPFAIVGVNGDGSADDAKKAMRKESMTWPSFWDKGGPNGDIPEKWNVHGWPTYYVLDPRGVIQLKDEGYGFTTSNQLTFTIDRLLKNPPAQKSNASL